MSRSKYEAQIRKTLADRQQETAIDFDGVPFTWGDANATACAVERTLIEAGLAEGEKAALLGRNLPAHYAALWGIFVSARCASMVHAFQPPAALASDISENRWPVIFGDARDWTPEVVAAAEAAGSVGYVLTADTAKPLDRVTTFEKPGRQTDRSADETALQLLSSGTTGKPKRIFLRRPAIDEMIENVATFFSIKGSIEKSTQIYIGALTTLAGPSAALPAATLGQRLAIQEKFNALRVLELIRRYRPPYLALPPPALAMLLQLNPSREDLSSVKFIAGGGTMFDPNVRERVENEYGLPVMLVYGATEFAGAVTGWLSEDMKFLRAKSASSGRVLPGLKVRIVSQETGEILPGGEVGVLEALVPRVNPDWVRTNDLARVDEDGFVYVEGRVDDVILRGGFKVHAEEIAELLRTHPKVADAALIGIPDERVGAVPAAVIERRVGAPAPTAEELEAYLRTKLAGYKIPARFVIVDEIPRTGTLKPRRQDLRALFRL
jgi:long-chain acyl-CoA synthetase